MVLIKSISGIRGTLGSQQGEDLTKEDILKFVSSYAIILINQSNNNLVLVGRDARKSGLDFSKIVIGIENTLQLREILNYRSKKIKINFSNFHIKSRDIKKSKFLSK